MIKNKVLCVWNDYTEFLFSRVFFKNTLCELEAWNMVTLVDPLIFRFWNNHLLFYKKVNSVNTLFFCIFCIFHEKRKGKKGRKKRKKKKRKKEGKKERKRKEKKEEKKKNKEINVKRNPFIQWHELVPSGSVDRPTPVRPAWQHKSQCYHNLFFANG